MKRLLLLLTFLIPLMTFGQEIYQVCASDQIIYNNKNPKEVISAISFLKEKMNSGITKNISNETIVNSPKIIPVVFNMIKFTENQYSDEIETRNIAQSYVDLMNDFFANGEDNQNGTYGQSDANMYFVLANLAVDCQTSFNGVRVFDFEDYADQVVIDPYNQNYEWTPGDAIQPINVSTSAAVNAFGYHPDKYLNFYWMDFDYPPFILGGFSFIPNANGPDYGVFMHDYYWDDPNINSPVEIMTHEVGHFLGLPHTFEGHDDCNSALNEGDCSIEGDGICDTPPTKKTWACEQPCNGITADLANFMSYTRGDCGYFGFTDGQINQMHTVMEAFKPLMVQQGIDCYGGSGGPGCTNQTACNFNPFASSDDGSCIFQDLAFQCGGNCFSPKTNIDGDYICDDIDNCTDINACNYDDSANDFCKYLDVCGICGGPGETELCGCEGIVPPACNCDQTLWDFDGDGICDNGSDYPPPTGGPQITLGDCPEKIDLVLSLDLSQSLGDDNNDLIDQLSACRALLDYLYPAIVSEDIRIGLAGFGGDWPVSSEHLLLPLITGQDSWGVLNNALEYYIGSSILGSYTIPETALDAGYHTIARPSSYRLNTRKAIIVVTDGDWEDLRDIPLADYRLQIEEGTYFPTINDYGTPIDPILGNPIPGVSANVSGIVLLDGVDDQSHIARVTAMCGENNTDVFPALYLEDLQNLFPELLNSICEEADPCVTTNNIDPNNIALVHKDTLTFLLPNLQIVNDQNSSEDLDYSIFHETINSSESWGVNYTLGRKVFWQNSYLTEHNVAIDDLTSNITSGLHRFRIQVGTGQQYCSTTIDINCNPDTSIWFNILPTLPGPSNLNTSTSLTYRTPHISNNKLAVSYYGHENKIRVPYYPNGRYFISKINTLTSTDQVTIPKQCTIYDPPTGAVYECIEESYVEVDFADIVINQNIDFRATPEPPEGQPWEGAFYAPGKILAPKYDILGDDVENYRPKVAELNIEPYVSQYFDRDVDMLKVHIVPFGKILNDVNATGLECADCEYNFNLPSCDYVLENINVGYYEPEDTWKLYYKSPRAQGNLDQQSVFFNEWGLDLQGNVTTLQYTITDSQGTTHQFTSYDRQEYNSNISVSPEEDISGFYRAINVKIDGLKQYVDEHSSESIILTVTTPNGCSKDFILNSPCQNQAEVTYYSESYNLIEIGNRCWFDRELRTTNFKNGDPIAFEQNAQMWKKGESPMYTKPTAEEDTEHYLWGSPTDFNDTDNNRFKYGVLYNWYVINDERGLCPSGFHAANNSDWNDLEKTIFGAKANKLTKQSNSIYGDNVISKLDNYLFLGMESNAYPSISGENIGLLGGIRVGVDGTFRESRTARYWWVAEEYPAKPLEFNRQKSAWARGIKIVPDVNDPSIWDDSKDGFGRYRDLWSTSYNKSNGLYIRCVKDL